MTLLQRAWSGWKAAPVTPVSRDWTYNWPWQDEYGGGGGSIGLPGGLSWSYARMYESQPWVFVAVNKLARDMGRLPLKLYHKDTDGKRTRVTTGDLADLLRRPHEGCWPGLFKEQIATDMLIYGTTIIVKTGKKNQPPTGLYPVSPVGWSLNEDGSYRWQGGPEGKEKTYEPWQIIRLFHYAPGRRAGVSPLEPLRMTLAIEYGAQRLGASTFENGNRPGGVLSTDRELSPEATTRLSAQVSAIHGGVKNAGKLAILTGGLKWQPMNWNLTESAAIEHRKLTREEVAAAFDIPPPMIGILDRATFSNIETQQRMFYTGTLGPWLTLIEEGLGEQLIAPVPAFAGHYAEFDLGEVMKGDLRGRSAAYSQALTSGWLTQNEVRELENREKHPDPDADMLHRPLNLSPAPEEPETERPTQTDAATGAGNG